MSGARFRALSCAAMVAVAAAVVAGTQAAQAAEGQIVGAGHQDSIPGQYLVTFRDAVQQNAVGATAEDLAAEHDGQVGHLYRHALRGFSVRMSEQQAKKLAAEPTVARVEQDGRKRALDVQTNPPSWGIDRIDQRDLPLDQRFTYPANAGQGATVYVIDSGIRASHRDFGGRATSGRDFVDNDNDATDCNGHGTHVAGTAAGATFGVAKKASIVAVRVLDCSGSGSDSGIIAAIDWVKANARKPAVVNYSVGCGSPCTNATLDNAVKALIATGVQWVQAAGNSNDDACRYSPQLVPEAITVGNSNQQDGRYVGSGTSSYGRCLDIWAPGTSIVSASHTSDTGSSTKTGTSMASPTVAGSAALYLGANPNATPQQVRDALVDNSIPNKVTNAGTGSPSNLLNTEFLNGGGGDTQAPTAPASLRSTGVTADSVSLSWTASTDNVGVTGYDLYRGASLATTVTGTSATVGGLAADTEHTFTVKAKDAAGNVSPASNAVTARTSPGGGDDAITNGGFESGLTGWTAGGTGDSATVVDAGAHSGSRALRLGDTVATNGVSQVSQTFTAPAGATRLSFWYHAFCPDKVTYAWAMATLADNTASTTTTPLAKTCTDGAGWQPVSVPVTSGNSYTLTLVNRDDNHPDDPVRTLFDDVSFVS